MTFRVSCGFERWGIAHMVKRMIPLQYVYKIAGHGKIMNEIV
jgi:hypothetical protein